MPRVPRGRCAFDEPAPKPKPTRPRVVLTAEEKAAKKEEAAARKEQKEKRKQWEDSLQKWKGEDERRGTLLPDGTQCLYKSEAKKFYSLSDKELEALPFYIFANSSRQIMPIAPIIEHVKSRFEATGIVPPMFKPSEVVLSARHRKNITFKSTVLENLDTVKAHPELQLTAEAFQLLTASSSSSMWRMF
ncbi:hypothetical protein PsYK624_117100 [Phanerochaete sordida]|uniref:Uncharacterized protein n=1 Tax=Phanerochaete sordida TaxID=48140 RepID=A0A9P3GI66_9APHY|nr:hypothetical protein PsYK624_117100 [Phanerochaete sordida]